MEKLIIALLVFLPLSLNAQWEVLNDGFTDFMSTQDFIDEDIGWIAGLHGTLYKTIDGGENWTSIPYNESWNFRIIDFINESIGWASGTIGWEIAAAWKTTDGGFSWFQQLSNVEFNSLHAIDENNIYAIGGETIFKTTNGGTDWIDVSPNLTDRNYNSLWFQDSQTGVIVGNYNGGTADRGVILKTTNGGTNWTETIVNEFNNIYDLQFLDNTNGYFRANNDSVNFIYKTDDMLLNWVLKTQSPYSIGAYKFINSNLAYAIMGDSITANNLMKSSDGGVNWQIVQSLALYSRTISVNKIFLGNSGNGIMIGSFEGGWVLFKKLNDEDNWKIQKFSYPIRDVYFIDKDKGFIAGYSVAGSPCGSHCLYEGNIFSINDGGKNWDIKFYAVGRMKACVFVNELTGFSLTDGPIYKTTDTGNNWEVTYENNPDSTGFGFSGNDICFMDESTIWAVGIYFGTDTSGAGILSTTDGGDSWGLVKKFPNEGRLFSICFAKTTAWTVGDGGMVVKYTPQTGWVQQTSVTDLPLNKVFFSDDNNGWIAGGYHNEWDNSFQSILLKTTNGGTNWITVPNISYLFIDIAFIDNNLGWAIGYTQAGTGGILKTTDGGITWSIDTGNLPATLNALHIKDNYGWAVGDNGLILRTTDAGAVWVEDENNNSIPTEFVLEQNYPNPFNPSTKISWQSPVGSRQTIKIYDVLGREVATLVNEEKPAGNYEITFNPVSGTRQLASGIYFYQLKAGDHVSTKKMLLLK
jgi:photosystem II stability/assembly factor-like uncharacterized protein